MLNNKIIITGITGFLGSSFAQYYFQKNFQITGLARKMSADCVYPVILTSYSVPELYDIINRLTPDIVIHAAGAASVKNSLDNPVEDFNKSVTLFQSLLEAIRLSKHRPLVVFPSSAAVYGNPEILPIKENTPLNPISPYGYHKFMCELLAKEYSFCYNIPVFVARLFSVFGPKQKRLLLWEIFDQFQNNSEVVIQGTGDESRDYIYVDDLAEAIYQILLKFEQGVATPCSLLNIASGKSVYIKDVVYKIKEYLNSEKPVVFKGNKLKGNPSNWCADISAYLNMVEFTKSLSFEKRLKTLITTWQNNIPSPRPSPSKGEVAWLV